MDELDKDFRIAELNYESAVHQLKANKYASQILKLEKEIEELKLYIESLLDNKEE
jgi:hypothetical protein